MPGSLRKREVLGIPVLFLLFLTAAFLITRLPHLGFLPFVQDEAVYALMVGEQQDHMTLVPTLFGYPVSWKMAPFFWLYAFLGPVFSPLGIEAGFRFPSLIFGLLSLIPLFLILKHFSDDSAAFLSSIFYIASFVSIYPDSSLLIDSPAFLLILLSLYCYIVRGNPLAGGLLAAAAFTFKLVTSFMSPILAAGFFLLSGKKDLLSDRLFLASLTLPLLAAVLNYVLLSPFGGGDQVYFEELLPRLISSGTGLDIGTRFWLSLNTLGYSLGPVFLLSIIGFLKSARRNQFMSLWYALILLPFLAGTQYPWYYLPVLPAVCFFASNAVYDGSKTVRQNAGGLAVAAAVCAASLFLAWGAFLALHSLHYPEKAAGEALAGRENVLIIGHFRPGVLAYKGVLERQTLGHPLDFGYILGPSSFGGEDAAAFVRDYHTGIVPAANGSFSGMYTSGGIFRKDTNISSFDYLALCGDLGFKLNGPDTLVQAGDITVYAKPGVE